MKTGDGLTCSCWVSLMMKKGNKKECDKLLMRDVWEWFEGLLLICWCCITVVLLWIVPCYKNGHILTICVNMSFAVVFRHGDDKYYVIRGCIISRDVSRAAMNTIFRGTYCTPRWLLLSRTVSQAAMDAWTNMSPMGLGLRDNGCVSLGQTCITILDIASHCIALLYYWWTWSCVLPILWVPFCGTCDWWILSMLLKRCNC